MISFFLFTSMVVITMETNPAPKGHLKPLGSHRPSDGHIEILTTVPRPVEFWEKYVSKGEPVLFRGAANPSPGLKLWTDEYLLENYGKFKVKIESKLEKDNSPIGAFGIGQDSLQNFIRRYKEDDVYIVSQLPDPMGKDVVVPKCLLCGTIRTRLSEANLWFSSGGTKSLLHRDSDDAINCLYNGTKDWIMIHPKDEGNIPIAKEVLEAYGGFSVIDPERVDLLKHPQFVDVPWKYVNVKAGDCLFIPRGYWHLVTSGGNKNLAVSLLFGRIDNFETHNCDSTNVDAKMHLTEVGTVWTYDGFGIQTMGNNSPFELNETIHEMCIENLQSRITVEYIMEFLMEELQSEDVRNIVFKEWVDSYEEYVRNAAIQYVTILGDTDQKGYVTCDKVKSLPLDQLKELAQLMSMDPGNTEELEYYSISQKDITNLFIDVLESEISANQLISVEELSNEYLRIGGTEQGALTIVSMLDVNSDNIISKKELLENMNQVVSMYGRIQVFGNGAIMNGVEFDFANRQTNEIPDADEYQKDEL
ncbi:uncharacterized protein [Antedon mediterranea]|uniref:uncharacterized protein n=1 Tax=Antedon mediterranea TaxID=105859 RepID=UPI003AF8EC50